MIFGNGKASIEKSIGCLQSYLATLHNLTKGKLNAGRKGKAKLHES
jgi:hypothetical protein